MSSYDAWEQARNIEDVYDQRYEDDMTLFYAKMKVGNTTTPMWHILSSQKKPLCGWRSGEVAEETVTNQIDQGDQSCERCTAFFDAQIEVEIIRAGQVRRYGPTIHEYHITDVSNEPRDRDEMLDLCRKYVRRAKLQTDPGFHSLLEHVQCFRKMQGGRWLYQTGHEYTG